MKTYYFANPAVHNEIYGAEYPICIDLTEIERLAREWDLTTEELMEQFHEAIPEEIAEYGTYDS
jgi:hypothetical protein